MSVGGLGAHRNPLSKEMFLSADVIVGIGTKLEEMETSWRDGFLPDPRALYVQIDIDPAEHGRSIIPRFPITGDAKTVLKQILSIVAASGRALDAKAFMAHERVARICKAMAAVEAEAEKIATQRPRADTRPLGHSRRTQYVSEGDDDRRGCGLSFPANRRRNALFPSL